jgi:hypothetical protein
VDQIELFTLTSYTPSFSPSSFFLIFPLIKKNKKQLSINLAIEWLNWLKINWRLKWKKYNQKAQIQSTMHCECVNNVLHYWKQPFHSSFFLNFNIYNYNWKWMKFILNSVISSSLFTPVLIKNTLNFLWHLLCIAFNPQLSIIVFGL